MSSIPAPVVSHCGKQETPAAMPRYGFSYLLISYSYLPVLGGSEIEIQRVSAELKRRGHTPTIVCAGGDPMPRVRDWVDSCGLRVRRFGGRWTGRMRDVVFALGVAWTLMRRRREYEVAYFLMSGLHLAAGLPVARLLRKPIVMKFAGSSNLAGLQTTWLGRLELAFLRRWASYILILNPGMAEEALDAGFDRARIRWMPNPVDTDAFCPCSSEERAQLRLELGVDPDAPLTVFAGRFAPEKGLPWLIGAFAQVVREHPRAVLALAGDGYLRAELEQLVSSLHLDRNVIFTGRLSTEGVLKWLQAGDAFALVSAREGLPCSLLEAMSVGLVPVVSDIPAHAQLVEDGLTGIVTEVGNQGSIAQGLLRVLGDSAARTRMGAVARQRMVEQFATPKVGDRYEALFAECIARSAHRPVSQPVEAGSNGRAS